MSFLPVKECPRRGAGGGVGWSVDAQATAAAVRAVTSSSILDRADERQAYALSDGLAQALDAKDQVGARRDVVGRGLQPGEFDAPRDAGGGASVAVARVPQADVEAARQFLQRLGDVRIAPGSGVREEPRIRASLRDHDPLADVFRGVEVPTDMDAHAPGPAPP